MAERRGAFHSPSRVPKVCGRRPPPGHNGFQWKAPLECLRGPPLGNGIGGRRGGQGPRAAGEAATLKRGRSLRGGGTGFFWSFLKRGRFPVLAMGPYRASSRTFISHLRPHPIIPSGGLSTANFAPLGRPYTVMACRWAYGPRNLGRAVASCHAQASWEERESSVLPGSCASPPSSRPSRAQSPRFSS